MTCGTIPICHVACLLNSLKSKLNSLHPFATWHIKILPKYIKLNILVGREVGK
jgi:hypothetical protein